MAILTVNSGSSSLKLGIYSGDGRALLLAASASSIGEANGSLELTDAEGKALLKQQTSFLHQQDAFNAAYKAMQEHDCAAITAIGHRVVHGGPHLVTHQRMDEVALETLRKSVHFAPLHIPPALELIEHTQQEFPGVPQFACFDTAFHQTMPPEAFTYAIPKRYRDAGVRRYGFHGLSYESVVHTLGKDLPLRTVVAHLGSGASACAMLDGKSQDTSMGLSPTGGFPMATRPGDLDPGVVLLFERDLSTALPAMQPDQVETMLNHESGLKGLTGESDLKEIIAWADDGNSEAALALKVFCREIAKTIAGYFAVLGGLDLLAFTGGIGEHSARVRADVCASLSSLGGEVDPERNDSAHPKIISQKTSSFAVRVVTADENGQIARHVASLARSLVA